MTTTKQVLTTMRARLDELRPHVEEHERLTEAVRILDGDASKPAPYGLKRDGTPRAKPGRPRKAKPVTPDA